MYNRYIPREEYSWVRAGEEGKRPPAPRGSGGLRLPPFLSSGEGLSALFAPGDGTGVLSRALKALHLEDLDTGDILLLLIVLYLRGTTWIWSLPWAWCSLWALERIRLSSRSLQGVQYRPVGEGKFPVGGAGGLGGGVGGHTVDQSAVLL